MSTTRPEEVERADPRPPQLDPVETRTPVVELVETRTPVVEPVETSDPEVDPVETRTPVVEPVETSDPVVDPVETRTPEVEPVETPDPEVEPVETSPEETEPPVPDQESPVTDPKPPETDPKPPETETKSPVVEPVETPRRNPVLTWAIPAVVLCVLVAGLVTWWRATGHDQEMVDDAAHRDRVLIVATSHIETLNSLDYREVDKGLKSWADVTTGTLHDQLVQVGEEDRKLLADQQKISTGSVMDAALTDLDDQTATVIAAVEITVQDGSDPDAEPTVKRNRFAADLVKVGDDWLLESLEQVAVNMS